MIALIFEKYSIDSLSILGSYIRDEERSDSDLDVLVSFREAPGLIHLVRIENYLSDELGVRESEKMYLFIDGG